LYEFNKLNIKIPFLGGNPVLVWVENEEILNQGGAYDNGFTINGVLLLIKAEYLSLLKYSSRESIL
jgi:hypothetical protein